MDYDMIDQMIEYSLKRFFKDIDTDAYMKYLYDSDRLGEIATNALALSAANTLYVDVEAFVANCLSLYWIEYIEK